MLSKTCRKCGVELELNSENFFKKKMGEGGYEAQCKECVKKRRLKRYKPVIYKITNNISGRVYIGKTIKPITERFSHHVTRSKEGLHKTPLYIDINKLGKDKFEISIIEEVNDESLLDERESYWIKKYRENDIDLVYNLDSGGSKGKQPSDETRTKMSRSAGTKEPIVVYDWVTGRLIGEYKTLTSVNTATGASFNSVNSNVTKHGWAICKNLICTYISNIDSREDALEYMESNYRIGKNGIAKNIVLKSDNTKGSRNPRAKLNEDTVRMIIKDLLDGKRNKDLVRKYELNASMISSINLRKTWSHIVIEGYEDVEAYNKLKKTRLDKQEEEM